MFGGRLTALRYPEKQVVSVPAQQIWYEPVKPFPSQAAAPTGTREPDELAITDVLGKRGVDTRLAGRVTVREENAAGALEVMGRFALEPRWLLYLPPTMSPTATTPDGDLLEHPDTAFDFYRRSGVEKVICEEKHMGSRAVVLLCRSPEVALRRFGAATGASGAVYTRTGRPFFPPDQTEQLLQQLRRAVDDSGLWGELDTEWLLLDAELLPWSVKAEDLLRHQYAAVGAAARAVLPAAVNVLEAVAARGIDVADLLGRTAARASNAEAFTDSYRRYIWPTTGLDGVQLAPFQLLATEGHTWTDHDHSWHLALIDRLVQAASALVRPTRHVLADTTDPTSTAAAVAWWEELTAGGGEGMVVKPFANLVDTGRGYAQSGIKVRGREYLRIIYGPDYTEPANLERLRDRNLGHKRSLAAREYALGVESEPVDPRL